MSSAVTPPPSDDWTTVASLNRFTFCPRLFHLMYVQGRWEENIHTLEGKDVHRRVDRIDHLLPETKSPTGEDADLEDSGNPDKSGNGTETDDADPPPEIARSVSLGCEELGLMGKLDLVSADPEGGEAVPVETKKSRVPNTPERSYAPERVQLMAQGLLLRAHGYRSEHGYLYFAGSRSRVRVDFTHELESETRGILAAVREARRATVMPPPLEDSPKCWGCSLCGICLPDETNALRAAAVADEEGRGGTVLVASGDRDAFQLASDKTTILQPVRAGEMARIGPAEVLERYGVEPAQVPDFIALRGDPSDKLPGARGVGPKGAANLLRRHPVPGHR